MNTTRRVTEVRSGINEANGNYWDQTAIWWKAADKLAAGNQLEGSDLRLLKQSLQSHQDVCVKQICTALIRLSLDTEATISENDDFTRWLTHRKPLQHDIKNSEYLGRAPENLTTIRERSAGKPKDGGQELLVGDVISEAVD